MRLRVGVGVGVRVGVGVGIVPPPLRGGGGEGGEEAGLVLVRLGRLAGLRRLVRLHLAVVVSVAPAWEQ